MVRTTKVNFEGYTSREITKANKARAGLAMVVNASTGDYINMVHSGLIRNCPITPQEVTTANTIFGPDIAALKGKTTRKSSEPVVTDYVDIP